MKSCAKCGKIYDPSMEFYDDCEALEVVLYFIQYTEREHLCEDCTCDLLKEMNKAVDKFFEGTGTDEN